MVCLSGEEPSELAALARAAASEAERGALTAQDLVDTLWAAAALVSEEAALPEVLQDELGLMADTLLGRAVDLEGRQAVEALWALAALREEAPLLQLLLPSLAERIVRGVNTLTAQDAATTVWAIATLKTEWASAGLRSEPIVALLARLLSDEEERDGGGENPAAGLPSEVLGCLLWAAATLKLEGELLEAVVCPAAGCLVERAARGELRSKPQVVSTSLWALASWEAGGAGQRLVRLALLPLLGAAGDAAALMKPGPLHVAIWAMGALARREGGCPGDERAALLRVAAGMRDVAVRAFSSTALGMPEVSRALWGLAAIGHGDRAMLDAAASRLVALAPGASRKSVAAHLPRAMWAFAVLDVSPLRLMEMTAYRLSATGGALRYLETQGLITLLWAFERLNESETELRMFQEVLGTKLKDFILKYRSYRLPHTEADNKIPLPERNGVAFARAVALGRLGPDADTAPRDVVVKAPRKPNPPKKKKPARPNDFIPWSLRD